MKMKHRVTSGLILMALCLTALLGFMGATPVQAAQDQATQDLPVRNLKATSAKDLQSILLSWDGEADGYAVYRQAWDGNPQLKMLACTSSTSFTDESIEDCGFYFYWIMPYRYVDGKAEFGELQGYSYSYTAPKSVKNLRAKTVGHEIHLDWEGSAKANRYSIFRRGTGDASAVRISETAGTSFVDRSAKPGANIYLVYAVADTNGTSVSSAGPENGNTYAVQPSPEPEAKPEPEPTQPGNDWMGAKYIANTNTGKFHWANCRWVGEMSNKHKLGFDSREEAVRWGYVPCGVCNP